MDVSGWRSQLPALRDRIRRSATEADGVAALLQVWALLQADALPEDGDEPHVAVPRWLVGAIADVLPALYVRVSSPGRHGSVTRAWRERVLKANRYMHAESLRQLEAISVRAAYRLVLFHEVRVLGLDPPAGVPSDVAYADVTDAHAARVRAAHVAVRRQRGEAAWCAALQAEYAVLAPLLGDRAFPTRLTAALRDAGRNAYHAAVAIERAKAETRNRAR